MAVTGLVPSLSLLIYFGVSLLLYLFSHCLPTLLDPGSLADLLHYFRKSFPQFLLSWWGSW